MRTEDVLIVFTGMRGAAYREDEVNITVNLNVIHRQSPKLVNDEFCLRLKQIFCPVLSSSRMGPILQ